MSSKKKLICFTYAGGTAKFFDIIEEDLAGIDLIKFEYAGHGTRHKEAFYPDFNALSSDFFEEIKKLDPTDYALFGYSMGSISAVEVLKKIIKEGLNLPRHVFLAAHEPHTKSELLDFSADELDEWVQERTLRFGDVPEKLVNNKVFWRTYLPIYRADYSIIGKYEFEKLDIKVDVSATIFYSETDTPYSEMRLWENYFTGDTRYKRYEGNHFFIREHHEEMA